MLTLSIPFASNYGYLVVALIRFLIGALQVLYYIIKIIFYKCSITRVQCGQRSVGFGLNGHIKLKEVDLFLLLFQVHG